MPIDCSAPADSGAEFLDLAECAGKRRADALDREADASADIHGGGEALLRRLHDAAELRKA